MVIMPHYDVVVVGMGAAGVTAASILARADKTVLGIEAQDRVGGRVYSQAFGEGVVELGAEWIHGDVSCSVYDAAINNNITLIPMSETMQSFRSDGSRDEEVDQLLDGVLATWMEGLGLEDTAEHKLLGEHVAETVTSLLKEVNPRLYNDDDFLSQLLQFLNLLANNFNASNDWNDCTTDSSFQSLGGHQHWSWHRYGYQTLFDILLNKYNGGPGLPTLDIRLRTEVSQISCPRDPREHVVVRTGDGSELTARTVLVTVSLGVLKERHAKMFSPKLPAEKIAAIEQISMGVMDKIELSYSSVWWPIDTRFFGFIWRGEDKAKVAEEDYWTTRIFGASRPLGANNVLTLWTSGEVAKMVETLPDDVVKRKCTELLKKFMGDVGSVQEPVDLKRSTWFSNPYTLGSYSFDNKDSHLHPNARSDLAAPLTDSSGNPRVLFAGEATHGTRFSTVDGASDSGRREAFKLLAKDKEHSKL